MDVDEYKHDCMNALLANKSDLRDMFETVRAGDEDQYGSNFYGEIQVFFVRGEEATGDGVEVRLYINSLIAAIGGGIGGTNDEETMFARNDMNDEIVKILCDVINPVYEIGGVDDVEFTYENPDSTSGYRFFRLNTTIPTE